LKYTLKTFVKVKEECVMYRFRKSLIFVMMIVIVTIFAGCSGGGGSSLLGGGSSGGANAGGNGNAGKGPFKVGSTVKAYYLLNGVRQTANATYPVQSTTTTDGKGNFTFGLTIPWSGPTEFVVFGEYLNENTGTYMNLPEDKALSAVVDVTEGQESPVNINVFTNIAAKKIIADLQAGSSIATAKAAAKADVKALFNLKGDTDLEALDLTNSDNEDNTQLLRVSAALLNTADPDETMDKLADDLADGDGINDEAVAVFDELKERAKEVDLNEVSTVMEEADIGVTDAPDQEADMTGKLAWDHNLSFESTMDAYRSTPYTSNEVTVSDIFGESGAISISGGEYIIDGGAPSSAAGTVSNGQKLKIKATSAAAYDTQKVVTVTIGGLDITYTITTKSDPFVADTEPNTFSFGFKRDQARNSVVSSAPVTITGINTAATISIDYGEYKINNGSWTSATGTVDNDDNVTVRHYSSDAYNTKKPSTLTVGGVSGTFNSYTVVEDKNPNVFTFADVNDVELSTLVESSSQTITGINSAAPISITGGEYKIGNGAWTTAAGTITSGLPVTVRQTSASTYNTAQTETSLTVGNVVAKFKTITKQDDRVVDSTPNAFSFAYAGDQNLSTDVESATVIISGISQRSIDEGAVAVSITHGEYSLNGGAYTAVAGTIASLNSTIKVKQTTANAFSTAKETTLTIGGVNGIFKTITKTEDLTPDTFSFDANESAPTATEITSNTVTISGINSDAAISVSAGSEYELNGSGTWVSAAGTVSDGDTIAVRHTSSTDQGAITVTTLTVGTLSTSFTSKTVVNAPALVDTPVTTVAEDAEYSYTPEEGNTSGEIASWSITNKPSWADFNPITGELSGIPTNDDVNTTAGVSITATNPSGSDSVTFNLEVTNTNDAPTIEGTPITRIAEGSTYPSFVPTYDDVDTGDTKNFTISGKPAWLDIDAATGEISGNRALINSDVGSYPAITITVTDSADATASMSFDIEVVNTNNPPTISGTPDTNVSEDGTYTFTPTGEDNDVGDTLTYSIANKPAWADFDTATGTLSGTPTNDDVGTTSDIVITVTDAAGTSAALAAFDLEVINVNDAPTLSGMPDITIAEGEAYSFTPTYADDDAGDSKNFTLTNSPAWMGVNAATGEISGTAEVGASEGIVLTVTDGAGATAAITFDLEVTNVNDAPVLAAIGDIVVNEDANAVSVELNTTDEDTADTHFYEVDVNSTGIVTYSVTDDNLTITPVADAFGAVEFTITTSDGTLTDAQTFTFTVNAVDDDPLLEDVAAITIDEDTNTTVTLVATDVDGDAITYGATSSDTSIATVSVAGDQMTVSGVSEASGTLDINVTATANGVTVSKIAAVTVTAVNDAPVAEDSNETTVEDTNVTIDLTTLISDADGEIPTVTLTDPTNGTVIDEQNGSITYVPNADYFGIDSFTYTVTDAAGDTDTGTINVTITPVNDAPVANDGNETTTEDTPLDIDLTQYASDIDGEELTYSFVMAPLIVPPTDHGHVSVDANGTAHYTPNADFNGTDSFTYQVEDGNGSIDTGVITITVTPVNDLPEADDSNETVAEDGVLQVDLTALIRDNDGAADITDVQVAQGNDGNVTLDANGTAIYTPTPDFFGADSFTYTVTDTAGENATGTINVTVTPVNDDPVANDANVTTNEEVALPIDMRAYATDADNDELNITIVGGQEPSDGNITIDGMTLTYTPRLDFNGTDSFTYQATDGNGTSDTGVITVTVNNLNDTPVANDQNETIAEDGNVTINLITLISDADGEIPTVTLGTPSNGTVIDEQNGSVTYVPNANFFGADSFTYTATDEANASDTGTINVTVTPVNDDPVANDIDVSTNEDTDATINLASSVIDADGAEDIDFFGIVTSPSNGTVDLNITTGVAIYSPNADFNGSDSFTYGVQDLNGSISNAGTVTITVTAVNDTPEALDSNESVVEDNNLTIDLTTLISDADGEIPTVTLTQPTKGTVIDEQNGSITYVPNANFFGADSFTYTATDEANASDTGTINVTVTPVNDAPVANDANLSTLVNTPLEVDLANHADDVDDTNLTYSIFMQPEPGKGTVDLNGSIATFTPATDINGSVSFTYSVSDGNASSDTGVIYINVVTTATVPTLADFNGSIAENSDIGSLVGAITITDNGGAEVTAITLTGTGSGKFTVTPNGDINTTGSLDFEDTPFYALRAVATNSEGNSTRVDVNITILDANDAPIVANGSASTIENTPIDLNITILVSDEDAGAVIASVEAENNASTPNATDNGGTLTINPDKTITYQPATSFTGVDRFSYRVNDGTDNSNWADINVTVTAGGAPSTITFVDPYINRARAWADVNGDGIQDANELSTKSDLNGTAEFAIYIPDGTPVQMIQQGLHNGRPFDGNLSASYDASHGLISPITSVATVGFSDQEIIDILTQNGMTTAEFNTTITQEELYMDPFDPSLLPLDGNMSGFTDDQIQQFRRVIVANVAINSALSLQNGYAISKADMMANFFTDPDGAGAGLSPLGMMISGAINAMSVNDLRTTDDSRTHARIYVTIVNYLVDTLSADWGDLTAMNTAFGAKMAALESIINPLGDAYGLSKTVYGINDPKFGWVDVDNDESYRPMMYIQPHELGRHDVTIVYDDGGVDTNITFASDHSYAVDGADTGDSWIYTNGDLNVTYNGGENIKLHGDIIFINGVEYNVLDVYYNGNNFHNDHAPQIVSNGGGGIIDLNVTEGTTEVTTLQAIDPDGDVYYNRVALNIVGGPDYSWFTIQPDKTLVFNQAPSVDNNDSADGDDIYTVMVMASDGDYNTTQTINVEVLSNQGGGGQEQVATRPTSLEELNGYKLTNQVGEVYYFAENYIFFDDNDGADRINTPVMINGQIKSDMYENNGYYDMIAFSEDNASIVIEYFEDGQSAEIETIDAANLVVYNVETDLAPKLQPFAQPMNALIGNSVMYNVYVEENTTMRDGYNYYNSTHVNITTESDNGNDGWTSEVDGNVSYTITNNIVQINISDAPQCDSGTEYQYFLDLNETDARIITMGQNTCDGETDSWNFVSDQTFADLNPSGYGNGEGGAQTPTLRNTYMSELQGKRLTNSSSNIYYFGDDYAFFDNGSGDDSVMRVFEVDGKVQIDVNATGGIYDLIAISEDNASIVVEYFENSVSQGTETIDIADLSAYDIQGELVPLLDALALPVDSATLQSWGRMHGVDVEDGIRVRSSRHYYSATHVNYRDEQDTTGTNSWSDITFDANATYAIANGNKINVDFSLGCQNGDGESIYIMGIDSDGGETSLRIVEIGGADCGDGYESWNQMSEPTTYDGNPDDYIYPSEYNTTQNNTTLAQGQAIDPHIVGAQFFADINNNGVYDAGDVMSTETDLNGTFTFDQNINDGTIVMIDPNNRGLHNGVPFRGDIKGRFQADRGGIISPITTLEADDFNTTEIVTLLVTNGLDSNLSADELFLDPFSTDLLPANGDMSEGSGYTDAQIAKLRRVLIANSALNMAHRMTATGYSATKADIQGNFNGTNSPLGMMIQIANDAINIGDFRQYNARYVARMYITMTDYISDYLKEYTAGVNRQTAFTNLLYDLRATQEKVMTAYIDAAMLGIADPEFIWDHNRSRVMFAVSENEVPNGQESVKIIYGENNDSVTFDIDGYIYLNDAVTNSGRWDYNATTNRLTGNGARYQLRGREIVIASVHYTIHDVYLGNNNFVNENDGESAEDTLNVTMTYSPHAPFVDTDLDIFSTLDFRDILHETLAISGGSVLGKEFKYDEQSQTWGEEANISDTISDIDGNAMFHVVDGQTGEGVDITITQTRKVETVNDLNVSARNIVELAIDINVTAAAAEADIPWEELYWNETYYTDVSTRTEGKITSIDHLELFYTTVDPNDDNSTRAIHIDDNQSITLGEGGTIYTAERIGTLINGSSKYGRGTQIDGTWTINNEDQLDIHITSRNKRLYQRVRNVDTNNTYVDQKDQSLVGYTSTHKLYTLDGVTSTDQMSCAARYMMSGLYPDPGVDDCNWTQGGGDQGGEEGPSFDSNVSNGEQVDGVQFNGAPGAVVYFNNLNSGENLSDHYGGQAALSISGTVMGRIDYTTSYEGKSIGVAYSGSIYGGTLSNGTVVLTEQ
jgi:hypothetical protein